MSWYREYKESTSKTKWFIFNWLFYMILTIITAVYCYGRLDFVRTGAAKPQLMEQK